MLIYSATPNGQGRSAEYSHPLGGMCGLGLSFGTKPPPILAFFQDPNTVPVERTRHLFMLSKVTEELLVFIQTALSVLTIEALSAEPTSPPPSTQTSSPEAASQEIESLIRVAEQVQSSMQENLNTFSQLVLKLKTPPTDSPSSE